MPNVKMQGNNIHDSSGRRIGYIQGNDIRDDRGGRLGYVQGDFILDDRGNRIAFVRGSDICDDRGSRIGSIDNAHNSIEGGFGGITLAAVWIFFVSVFTRLQSIVASHKGLSKPQLICVPTEYCVQKTRVMVVGQQTYGWDDTIFSDGSYSPKQLMNLYANFTQSRQSKGSPFWQAGSKLQTIVNTGQPSHSFLWSNLVKLDQSNGRPDADAENDICRLGILQKEIDITQPDAVVFFTGPKYDERLKETFPGLKCTPEVGLLIRIKHPCLPKLCYRTYHPKYLRFSRNWKVIQEIAEEIKHARQLTNG